MTRRLLALALSAGVAAAAPVPKAPPPPNPKASASLQLATAKMNGENIQLTQTVDVTQYITVVEAVNQNGQQVQITKVVPQVKQLTQTYMMTTKGLKATTADGKEVSEEDLVKKLENAAAVVTVPQGFDPEWKKLFADDVLFLESVPQKGGVIRPGGPAILPVQLVPLPAPVPLPVPVEKDVQVLPVERK